ncbi:MAG: segregation/condensation protein A [Candidatus Latescibacterota bacterium]|nr:segregation/condensation protein A [Candidatus Latescibacterota bacterium]
MTEHVELESATFPAETVPTSEPYGIKVDVFEGPLDLLLYLIRKNEVVVYDIPVATITAQYLDFLSQGVHLLDLEAAADFILMAATLMKIKSQMLLPREIDEEESEEEGDPRQELVRRLLEYQQFKEIADWLSNEKLEQRDIFQRSSGDAGDSGETELESVSLFDLLKVYKHVLDHIPQSVVHRIIEEQASVEESIGRILDELGRRSRLRFFDLVAGHSRQSTVATFIGILELLKSQRIRVQQAHPFDDIWIEQRGEFSGGQPVDE